MTKSVALIDDGFQTHKCIYNIAYAYYKLGKLRQSRLFCERLLKLDPLNQQGAGTSTSSWTPWCSKVGDERWM